MQTSPRTEAVSAGTESAEHSVSSANNPPVLVLRTTPPADPSTQPFPTISGAAPLTVRFNLCRSEDPDPGDSLNWQFNFGDERPLSPDLTSGWDFARVCRVEHTYRQGQYAATVSVTDKHLEDQGHVSMQARVVQRLTIIASGGAEPGAPAPPAAPVCPTGGPCLVFLTSTGHTGALGGLAGADAICQARATAAGRPGTYRAWLSDTTGSPSTRFTQSAGPYVLVNGTTIANNWADLTDGTLAAPINVTELGTVVGPPIAVFTGTRPNGTADPFDHCQNWTMAAVGAGVGGSVIDTDARWTAFALFGCSDMRRLYCFQQN